MKFEYKKECNLKEGQKLFGIVAVSIYTYDGVQPVTVFDIDYNEEEVIFEVEQPCRFVACSFREIETLVWESKEQAERAKSMLDFGLGMYPYEYDY